MNRWLLSGTLLSTSWPAVCLGARSLLMMHVCACSSDYLCGTEIFTVYHSDRDISNHSIEQEAESQIQQSTSCLLFTAVGCPHNRSEKGRKVLLKEWIKHWLGKGGWKNVCSCIKVLSSPHFTEIPLRDYLVREENHFTVHLLHCTTVKLLKAFSTISVFGLYKTHLWSFVRAQVWSANSFMWLSKIHLETTSWAS